MKDRKRVLKFEATCSVLHYPGKTSKSDAKKPAPTGKRHCRDDGDDDDGAAARVSFIIS